MMLRKIKYLYLFLLILIILLFVWVIKGTAATNIDSTNHWAWSDTTGWWDFYNTDTVEVSTSSLRGYASSSTGEMALNCNSTPLGDMCATSDFAVTNPDGSGSLSGCGWNDTLGWISFWCGDGDCDGSSTEDASSTCSSSNYQVSIDANGVFSGYAWNDIEGWISFNCSNDSSCETSDYKVETAWRPGRLTGTVTSPVIDSEKTYGVTPVAIVWQGTQPAGTTVDFQVAVSNSTSGPWSFEGPGGISSAWYGQECPLVGESNPAAGPSKSICLDKNLVKDNRYVRYRARLQSNTAQSITPTVDSIVIIWSE